MYVQICDIYIIIYIDILYVCATLVIPRHLEVAPFEVNNTPSTCHTYSVPDSRFTGHPKGMVTAFTQKLQFACVVQQLIASHLLASCLLSEPQPSTCTLFAGFESHLCYLHTAYMLSI